MVMKDGAKMSKSKGNVVDPDDLIRTFGADTARLFSLFAAPPEKDLDWNDHGVEGASRFLNRIWRFVVGRLEEIGGGEAPSPLKIGGGASPPPIAPPAAAPVAASAAARVFRRTIHETIARVTDDIEHDFHFNTAISAIMELVNALYAFEAATQEVGPGNGAGADGALGGVTRAERTALLREAVETVVPLLAPFCPHITEELWAQLGHGDSVFRERWPVADPAALARQAVTVVVQVDGKVRSRLTVDVDATEDRVRQLALADDRVLPWVSGRRVERVVVVPNRLVNVVTVP
jgi:leucyl-tRNA synthetase